MRIDSSRRCLRTIPTPAVAPRLGSGTRAHPIALAVLLARALPLGGMTMAQTTSMTKPCKSSAPRISPEPPASEDPGRSVAATAHASTSINAPPLNIPIEELLRAERFTPAGLARTAAPASQASSGSHDLSSSASSSPHGQRRRLHRSPFALRQDRLRGATNSNLDILANLYEALASHAGLEQEMNFW